MRDGVCDLGWENSLIRDETDNGDAHGHRSLFGGVVLDPVGLPFSSSGETLGPASGPGGDGTMALLPS